MSEQLQPQTPGTNEPVGEDEAKPFVVYMPDDPLSRQDWYLWAVVLALMTIVAFLPSISGSTADYGWQDKSLVVNGPQLMDLNGLIHVWAPPIETVKYTPLTFTMFWIEHHFWQSALGFRAVNLLLHAGAAVVLWRLLRRL